MKSTKRRTIEIKKSLYRLALFSFAVVIVWVGFEIYWSYTGRDQELNLQQAITPVDPNLHLDLAQDLSQRTTISDQELQAFKARAKVRAQQISIEPTPPPTPIPPSSPSTSSGQPTIQDNPATQSGTLLGP